jgi:Zn-dependent M28 family amino/carboxypeptidase
MTTTLRDVIGDIWLSQEILQDFDTLCDFGGRVAGTESERRANSYLAKRLQQIAGDVTEHKFSVTGYTSTNHSVTLGSTDAELESTPLVNTVPIDGELALEVIDLGRGTPADFAAASTSIAGKAVLVRHEFPFSTGHVHRGIKYELAQKAGAAAFLIGNNQPNTGRISGSGGSGLKTDIPAFGLSYNSTLRVATRLTHGVERIVLRNTAEQHEWTGTNLLAKFPGTSERTIVLSAHIDGHGLAESAMDNASGLATILEVGRRLGPLAATQNIGLTIAMFTFEEWALTGSARYVESLSSKERANIFCNINVDTPVGYPRVFGLTASDPLIAELLTEASALGGTPIHQIPAYTSNSDHYNFLEAGIPAVRLIGGYNDETAKSRLLLTEADNREGVEPLELRHAAITTAMITWQALQRA